MFISLYKRYDLFYKYTIYYTFNPIFVNSFGKNVSNSLQKGAEIIIEKTGYMCYTRVTIKGVTHEMWLPVMDSHNDAMLAEARTVKTRNGEYTVPACTMFDVNKTIMRCLTKNLAMFGLGLYIYAGEDLPADEVAENDMLFNAVLDIINSGELTGDMLRKAEMYYQTKNIEGMKGLLAWYKENHKAA